MLEIKLSFCAEGVNKFYSDNCRQQENTRIHLFFLKCEVRKPMRIPSLRVLYATNNVHNEHSIKLLCKNN